MSSTSNGSGPATRPGQRLGRVLVTIALVLLLGTIGFRVIEGWPLITSFYVAVQTVTTVGYGDITPATQAGKVFATIFMLVGVGTVLFGLTTLVQSIIQFEIVEILDLRRRFRRMTKLRDHYIVCGAGRVGSRIIRELCSTNTSFVAIDLDPQKVAELIESGAHVIVRDATMEDTLREAGVEHARGLVACLPDDADNVYVVLIARDLNRDLHIVARAVEEQAEPKLIRAGANRVVAPTIIGSHRMAQALLKPAVADFMDSITAENLDLGFEQVDIAPGSEFAGKPLRGTRIRTELDTVVVAIRRKSGEILYHPNGDAVIEPNDTLIVIGRIESLRKLLSIARGQ